MTLSIPSARAFCGAALTLLALAPLTVHAESRAERYQNAQKKAESRQKNKNNMRNLAIAGAAVAGYGLLKHNNTATIIGAAGAGLAGSQYEKARKEQSQQSARNKRRYYRKHR